MNEKEKREYQEKYKKDKENGVPFFPDIIFKDAVVSLVIFVVLVALAYFLGVPMEARANPNDATYTPRPEWYFLFLFQLLKYFPGSLEVIGVMVIPGIFIVLLLALPFIDRNNRRHFMNRPVASIAGLAVVAGIVGLTVMSVREAPPPEIATPVDQAAALYAANCANCHGTSITVPPGTDLHQLIAQGKHQGMPAWGGDLSTDEIDALAGFITSPRGSALYTQYCGECHKTLVQASGNPQELQRVFAEGLKYPAHEGQNIPDWTTALTGTERNALLNFLAAPDGQRLFEINCSGCHGFGVSFSGTEAQLRDLISKGGQHLSMPAWRGTLSDADLETLANYVTNPAANPGGKTLFGQYCSACHADVVPSAPDLETARKIISGGGPHVTMPVWGQILTPEQMDALVQYTFAASKGQGTEEGSQLFASNCAACHGQFGEGGPNPTRSGDMIPPISSAEFLGTRDDATIRSIIAQGQPDLGMNPFGSSYGGPLSDDEIDSLVAFIRSWQANPPQVAPPQPPTPTATSAPPTKTAAETYQGVCAQCHGANGEGASGPALNTTDFQSEYDDQALYSIIHDGVPGTPMLAFGDLFSETQIKGLVDIVRGFASGEATTAPPASVSFKGDVQPILEANCAVCHSSSVKLGGWDLTSYETVMTTGENAPVVVAGDVDDSLLAELLQGTNGKTMPPQGGMSEPDIKIILDWIAAGAQDN
jgi:mono/diheme cytochrome c family protein